MPDIKLLTDRDARIVNGKFQYNDGEKWVDTQDAYKIYGLRINLMTPKPDFSTYFGDASGMIAGSDAWDFEDIFRDIRPCIVQATGIGLSKRYLNKSDFTKFEDGSDASAYLSNSLEHDVFIEIPKIGIKIVNDGTNLTIQLTRKSDLAGFSYKAHTHITQGDCPYIYVGAFLGYIHNGTLRSWANVLPTCEKTLSEMRVAASDNQHGHSYCQLNFYTVTLLQCLYLMRYGNRNSQTALGMGYVGGTSAKNTGATLNKGMYYGSTDPMEQMKFMGIEDFWGNIYQWVDGLVSTSDFHALTCCIPAKMNDSGEGYDDQGQITTSQVSGYMRMPHGTNDLGFIIKTDGGSSTSYFPDMANFFAERVPTFGDSFSGGSGAGAFSLYVNTPPADVLDSRGGRSMLVASTNIEEVDSFPTT